MDRGLPCSSKICAQRDQERRLESHVHRLRKIKPSVDTSLPRTLRLTHVHGNLKKEQMQEERYTEIDRENRILLQKMANIMKQPLSNSGPTTPREPRSLSAVPPRSLNSNARKKELLRITKENQMILKRIQQAQPVYNHVEWEGLNRRNLAYLKNSAEYPLVLRSARGGRTAELTRLDGIDQGGTMSARSAPLPESSARRAPGRADGTSRLVLSGKMVLDVEGAGAASGQTTFLVKMLTDGRSLRISARTRRSPWTSL